MRTVLVWVRRGWRRLTSMRTALILLFLLAVAAVPGSLLPQRNLDAAKTANYISSHGAWGTFLNDLGMFDVFGSVWFAAIYLLLFVSLIGCLIPRIRVHTRALLRKPLPAPRNLGRLPESGRFETSGPATRYADAARSALGRRWRVERREEPGGVVTLSAEKGYSRETGNIVFHVALLVALVLIAVGRLYMYEGEVIISQGDGFCNTPARYDSWTPGRFAADGDVSPAPFCVSDLRKFTATYSDQGEPQQFKAAIDYTTKPGSPTKQDTVEVNHPLRLEGDRLYLQGHGYSPRITLKMPGRAAITDTAPFLPTNATTFLSEGVFAEPGPVGAKQDIGIKGVFAPDAVDSTTGGAVTPTSAITSAGPSTTNPVLSVIVYKGDLNVNGLPHSVYTIDTSKMKQIDMVNLVPGQTVTLKGGGTLTYDTYVPWVNFQVSHDPAQGYLLFAALAMVLGLFGSLAIRRRRVWVRIAPADASQDGSPTVVTVGGLARSDSGNFTDEFANLLSRLTQAAGDGDGPDPGTGGTDEISSVTMDDAIEDDSIRAGKE
jgi:cytochrome c biogenesis protein